MILVPEATVFELALLPIVFIYEWSTRSPGSELSDCFKRSIRCVILGAFIGVAFLAYLLVTSSLSGFIHFYIAFSTDNAISKGLPVQWNLHTNHLTTFFWLAPMVLWLLTVARVAIKVAARSAWSHMDWTILAAATMGITYYLKAIQRADAPHVAEAFAVNLPIFILWTVEILGWMDRTARRIIHHVILGVRQGRDVLGVFVAPATIGALAAVMILAPLPLHTLRSVPGRFHALSPVEPPATPRLGYTIPGAVDTNVINSLGAVINRYASKNAPVMDFTNQLGIVYYVLNRESTDQYYHIDEGATLSSQQSVVAQVRRVNPPVVVYSTMIFGLPVFDYLPMMVRDYDVSEYLLANYRPIVNVGTELVLIRNNLAAHPKPLPAVSVPTLTTGLYFTSFECNFGDIFNFYKTPASLGSNHGITARLAPTSTSGTWKIDLPPHTELTRFQWIRIESHQNLGSATFELSDSVDASPSHVIAFESLPSSGDEINVLVSGCLEWHGYDSSSLYLTTSVALNSGLSLAIIR